LQRTPKDRRGPQEAEQARQAHESQRGKELSEDGNRDQHDRCIEPMGPQRGPLTPSGESTTSSSAAKIAQITQFETVAAVFKPSDDAPFSINRTGMSASVATSTRGSNGW
jgi:hypothetical protein